MPSVVTWNDGTNPAAQFTVPDDVMASLDQFRLTVQSFQNGAFQPTYATVQQMIVGFFVTNLVMPALALFPTATLKTAQDNLTSAQAALAQAQAAAVPGFVAAPPTT
jgi:hypothetical protein